MFKKRFIIPGIVAVIICAILIPPVRAAAESVLSVFRVADVKTIRISVSDLQDILTFVENKGPSDQETEAEDILAQLMEKAEAGIRPISDAGEFTAFPFSLPSALKAETPELYAADSQSQTVTLDTAKINTALTELGAATLLDSRYNGTAVTVSTPPAVIADYDDVTLLATQTLDVDAPDDVVKGLYAGFLSIPAISADLRAQLAAIDPTSQDVYLPVIEGLGREISIGGTTGFVYSSDALANVLSMLPGFADDASLTELRDENASVLVWLKDGVLYCLAGEKSDSELAQIARSIG
jgi:hypothetical protein